MTRINRNAGTCFLLRFQESVAGQEAVDTGTKTAVKSEQPDQMRIALTTKTMSEVKAEQADTDIRHQPLLSIPR
jgi:hypothetical protein